MSLYSLRGKWAYKAGASGSPTLPKGAQILSIVAHASAGSASVAINGGDAYPVINGAAPTVLQFKHLLLRAESTTPVVFASTDGYFIEFVSPEGNAAASFG